MEPAIALPLSLLLIILTPLYIPASVWTVDADEPQYFNAFL
jgi:hypothetical protein